MSNDVTDDRLVVVFIKIRDAIAEVNKEYDARLKVLKDQKDKVGTELLRRLHERGSKQTKTDAGTAFISETMAVTIADEDLFGNFVLAEQDYSFYQKRVKVEHLKEYMKEHEGMLPPGLNVHRELEINVRRAPKKGDVNGGPASTGDDDTPEG
jgi:hypothetical protein